MSSPQEGEPTGGTTGLPQTGNHGLRILNAIRQVIRAADIDSRKLAAEHQDYQVPTGQRFARTARNLPKQQP